MCIRDRTGSAHASARAPEAPDPDLPVDLGADHLRRHRLRAIAGNRDPGGATSPVSYTHLDVYKRQVYVLVSKQGTKMIILRGQSCDILQRLYCYGRLTIRSLTIP